MLPQPYPGPARIPLIVQHLDQGAVQAILTRARRAGLLVHRPIDYGVMGITDLPTTQVTLRASGGVVVRRAYGLGVDAASLSGRARRARVGLERFIESLPRAARTTPLYTPAAVAVWIASSGGQAGVPPQSPVTWPLAGDLATLGRSVASNGLRCLLVQGADVRRVLSVVDAEANAATPWTSRPSGSARFGLAFRPLLPGEHGCVGGGFGAP